MLEAKTIMKKVVITLYPQDTLDKAIELLVAAGILAEVGERKRDRLYRYQNYLQLLE